MAFTVTFDESNQLARIAIFQPSNPPEAVTAVSSLTALPGFLPGCRILVDARESGFTPDVTAIRRFADFHTNHPVLRYCPTAIVTHDLVDYGMSNMFAILCQLKNSAVAGFRTVAEAENWLTTLSRNPIATGTTA